MRRRGSLGGARWRAGAGVLAVAWVLGIFLAGSVTRTAASADAASGEVEPEGTVSDVSVAFGETAGGEPPTGVLNARALQKGTIRLGYRYTRVWMRGNWNGADEIDASRVYGYQSPAFVSAPKSGTVQEHLVSAAWAPFSRLTLVARLPIYLQEQTADRAAGGRFRTRTDGVGDLRVIALVPFMRKGNETLLISFGFRAPTGSTRESGLVATSSGLGNGRLAYPLQPGEGSWALMPGVTYRGHWRRLSWGLQYQGVYYVDENSQGYRPGTEQAVSTWMAWNWASWVSTSARFAWHRRSNTHGGDPEIGVFPYTDPTADPMRQGSQELAVGPGLNLRVPFLRGPMLGVEALFPIWRELDGPQPGSRWRLHAGLKFDF